MLYVVATPIGNLEDITDRARRILTSVSYIACEDPNHSRILLQKIGSVAKTIALNAHSKSPKVDQVISLLLAGNDVAYITDAGTPGISDPGGILVEAAHNKEIEVCPIPGPSAVACALSVCGFCADQFIFYGYIPKKKGRQTFWLKLQNQKITAVMFESPDRIAKTLAEIRATIKPDRRVCICRELTKQFEQIWRGTIAQIESAKIMAKGEFVIVLEGD
ncbi:MAG: 16S rRNA (cytidine(1402)-2'-O)-methyltransferase [Patescibacteria group bacterium]|jgi:16S rRNA (cytidine1402-2'-O)-methyltransferase